MNELDEHLEECDCCHDIFDLFQIRLDEGGIYFYCNKCRSETGCSSAWQNVSLRD